MKILVTDNLSEEGIKILKEEGFEVEETGKLPPQQLKEKIKGIVALIVRSGTKVTAEVIQNADALKIIGRAGVGLDNIDLEEATRKGIMVMNTPTGNTISAAEHTISLLLSLARNIPQANDALKKGVWDRKKFMGVEVFGKTLGVVGLGRVGTHVARCALGLGMRVITYDPFISREKAKNLGVEWVEWEKLLSEADFITFHVPLTPHTKYLVGEKEFRLMKKGVRIINCSRGGIIDEKALYEAIKSGKVKGAALDVFEKEPPEDSPLLQLPEVIVTPHLGASTYEAQYNVAVEMGRQISDALKRGIYRNVVNLPQLSPEEWVNAQGYLQLCEKLGSFQGQRLKESLKEVRIEYLGEVNISNLSLLTSGILKGLFSTMLPGSITYVNAHLFAEERGIKVTERRDSKSEDFASLISVETKTSKEASKVSGTLFSGSIPRIVKVDQFHVEINPQGPLLLCYNVDRPGLIGKIGSLLGKEGINIAQMTFDRKVKGGEAITVLNLDSSPESKVLEKIREIPEVKGIEFLEL